MKNSKIGARYAKALFDLALEKDVLPRAYADMQQVYGVYTSNRDFRLMLSSPIVGIAKKKAIINEIFSKEVDTIVLMFLDILTAKRRESHIGTIAEEFIAMVKKHQGIFTATLITAAPATDDIREKATALVQQHTGGRVELVEEIRPSIIGGFVLKFGDQQYDASVLHGLNKLHREFEENIYMRGF